MRALRLTLRRFCCAVESSLAKAVKEEQAKERAEAHKGGAPHHEDAAGKAKEAGHETKEKAKEAGNRAKEEADNLTTRCDASNLSRFCKETGLQHVALTGSSLNLLLSVAWSGFEVHFVFTS